MVGEHPSRSELAGAAAGDTELRRRLAPHLQVCGACRDELARFLGVLEAAVEETVAARPGCPPPEVLAELSGEAARRDPHVRSCPLCQEELDLLRHLEASRRVVAAFDGGLPHRPELTVRSELPLAAAAPGQAAELELREGAQLELTMAGAGVRLVVSGGTLAVELAGEPERPLELLLENDLLRRRVGLAAGRTEVDVDGWTRARVRIAEGETG